MRCSAYEAITLWLQSWPLVGRVAELGVVRRNDNMKWEYKTIKLEATGFMGGKIDEAQLDRRMNELGAQGWELGAAFDTDVSGGGTRDVVVIFKRPKN
jgi:hypothetical protein